MVILMGCFLFGIFSCISFPLLIEVITRNLGKKYLGLGTGITYFFSRLITALLIYVIGYIINFQTRMNVMKCMILGISLVFACYIFAVYSEFRSLSKGKNNSRKSSADMKSSNNESNPLNV